IEYVLKKGQTAIVLVPENVLTPKLLAIFFSYFGEAVAVLHSSLPVGERYDEWKRIRDGEAKVVIGTRSAIFAPLDHIGLIVLDEEHEGTYQSESLVRYHARDIAKFRCTQNKSLLLLGSATPAIETMYAAQTGVYHLFELRERFNEKALPNVMKVDMKNELRAGNGSGISMLLRAELEKNFARGEQSILFINRRGTNRMVSCGICGAVPACPRCSVYLTYHAANHRLMCHYCGYSEKLPEQCPACGGKLEFIGSGTQKIQAELKELYPDIEVLRMDTDTVSVTQSHEVLLERFERKRIPILLGTQMVAKGLDFENVTLVGVIAADLSLYVDHFRATERTFSLITQVVGRAGRGEKLGRAIIQTWTPENEVIELAAVQDYTQFYEKECEIRRLRNFPPYSDLFRLTVSGIEESAVLRVCTALRKSLDLWYSEHENTVAIFGPAPAPILKVNERYRYRITINCKNTANMRGMLAALLRMAQSDRSNRGLTITADLNPMN
ncbi:MAG: primosomal protein N', partial [Evtepia sp.]